MSDVRFIDTTVRDGNQSLWALNMRTDHMLAVAEHIDEAGFESVEFFVTVMFKKLVREQKENAWDWFRLGTQRFKKTPLQAPRRAQAHREDPGLRLRADDPADHGLRHHPDPHLQLLEQLRRVQRGKDRSSRSSAWTRW